MVVRDIHTGSCADEGDQLWQIGLDGISLHAEMTEAVEQLEESLDV